MATMYPLFCSLLLTAVCGIVGTGDVFLAMQLHSDNVIRLQRDVGKSTSRINNLNVASAGRGRQEGRAVVAIRCSDTLLGTFGKTKVPCPSGIEDRNNILAIAAKELGVREATGNNDGKRVEEYLRYTHLGKGYAWCAAFVSWCYGQAGLSQPRNPWAPALFPKSRKYSVERIAYSDVRLPRRYTPRNDGDRGKSNNRTNNLNVASAARGMQEGRTVVAIRCSDQAWALGRYQVPCQSGIEDMKADIFGIYSASVRRINHVGLIKEVQGKYLLTIEGNSHDRVESRRRPLSTIYAFADWVNE